MVGFPLLLIPLTVYNIIVFLMPGVSIADPLLKLTLMSGAEWQVTLSDILLASGILLLLLEVVKAARSGTKYLTDHLLSLIVFAAAAAEFVMWPKFGNSTYLLLTMMAMAEFLAGIALRSRRGIVVASAPAGKHLRNADVSAAEPQSGPLPAAASPAPATSSVPAAASIAESILLDRSEPTLAQPAVAAPGLQPGGSSDVQQR